MKRVYRSILWGAVALLGTTAGARAQSTIYVNGAVGSSGDGLTPATAKKTVAEGLALADVTGNLINPSTADLWTLFDAAVAWADNVTPPVAGAPAALIVSVDVFAEGLANTTTPDGLIHDRLVSLGYSVQVVSEADVGGAFTIATAETKDLVVICESVGSANMDPLIGANVPIVTNEAFMYNNWYWTTSDGANRPGTQITITDAGHALAAGLSGTVDVYTEQHGISTVSIADNGLVASAQAVASVVGDADKVAIFGLEAGAALHPGGPVANAPQRRVGFLIFSDPDFLTRDFPPGLKVAVAQGVYAEAATLQMGGYRLEGGWSTGFTTRNPDPSLTTLDGLQNKRILEIIGTNDFSVDGFTFFHGTFTGTDTATDYFGGGFLVDGSTSGVINNCVFDSNTLTGDADDPYGGALAIDDSGDIMVSNCVFTNNRVTGNGDDGEGGAMRIDDGTYVTVINCEFTENLVDCSSADIDPKGGALSMDDSNNITVTNCTFTSNSLVSHETGDNDHDPRGGAVRVDDSSFVEISHCTFTGNSITGVWDDAHGGALSLDDGDDVTVIDCTFTGNFVNDPDKTNDGEYAGAIGTDDGTRLLIRDCTFDGNFSSDDNGAVYINDNAEDGLMLNCVFTGNYASDDRGVMEIDSSNFTVRNCSFIANSAGDDTIIQLENTYEFNNGADGIDATADDTYAMYSVTFDGCLFQDNAMNGTDGDHLFGFNDNCGANTELVALINCVFLDNSNVDDRMLEVKGLNILVANCTFYGNNIADQELVSWRNNDNDDDRGFITNPFVAPSQMDFDNRSARLINCIFADNVVGNGDYLIDGRDHDPDPDFRFIWTEVANNIFHNNTRQDGTPLDGVGTDVGLLDGQGGITPNIPITLDGRLTGNGNFDADPLFVGAATGDFHLQSASEAIDAGQWLAAVTIDFDGVPRPIGDTHDIGAFEYITAPAAPSNLQAVGAGTDAIMLSWVDNSDDEAGFKIERHDDGANPTFAEIVQVGINATLYLDRGLDTATTYTYRVRAFNFAGNSAYSNEASASPGGTLDAERWTLYR